MALIACSECKNQISEKAGSCPHCGYKLKGTVNNSANLLLKYLDVASKYRHNEFHIQMVRGAVITGMQAALFISFGAIINHDSRMAMVIAVFGIFLTGCWISYYRRSLYWTWYWELRARQINRLLLPKINIADDDEANLFRGHPAGGEFDKPPDFDFGSKKRKHKDVHDILIIPQIVLFVVWIILAVSAFTL